MMTIPILIHTTTIERKVKIAGQGLSSEFQTIATGVKCLALPATNEDTLRERVVIGQDYNVTFDETVDIRKGDRLTISTGIILLVNGVANYKDVPIVAHIECACSTES